VRKNYQRKERKSNHKFEVVRGQELLVQVPLPMAEVWAEIQAQVEELTGQAGLREPGVLQRIALLTAAKISDSADDFFRIVTAGQRAFGVHPIALRLAQRSLQQLRAPLTVAAY
jgi:hypothetical protein